MTETLTGTPALDAINAALATVQDPEINRPLTELGMVKDVQIGAGAPSASRSTSPSPAARCARPSRTGSPPPCPPSPA